MISAKIIADSISPDYIRLTTFHLRYPRMVHADFMTHRVFSRNGRSSRAVPVATLLKEDPWIPDWHYNKPGMQAAERLTPEDDAEATAIWLDLVNYTKNAVEKLSKIGGKGVHKQWANRPLEWFGFIDVLVTSTTWVNFICLRDHPDAQPEIQQVGYLMWNELKLNEPQRLVHGEWHLPYIDHDERGIYDNETLLKLSTARCARLSYKPFDGNADLEKEFERYEKLVGSQPVHASPAEHQATPDEFIKECGIWHQEHLHGNLTGWIQHRKMLPHENIEIDSQGRV